MTRRATPLMLDSLYLAWRYLVFHRWKTAILVASITLILFLPAGLETLLSQSSRHLRSRASATPLLVGARGSRLELVLNSLYFSAEVPPLTQMAECERVRRSNLATAIPLYVRFRARQVPIVGTTLDYFRFRGLSIARGSQLGLLGDCVVGARAAETLHLEPGDSVLSSPESLFDLAGVYPLKMRVVGQLAPTGMPDDEAIFVDVKTAWIIQGLGHGHQDLSAPESAGLVLERQGRRITANAAVVQFNEITAENMESFHFHGDPSQFPLTAVIAVPRDRKSQALLMGRYQSPQETALILEPSQVIDELLDTVVKVRSFIVAAAVLLDVSTLLAVVLVFLLSLRLRRREIVTMTKLGCSRLKIVTLVGGEILMVLCLSTLLAGGLTLVTRAFGAAAIQWFLL